MMRPVVVFEEGAEAGFAATAAFAVAVVAASLSPSTRATAGAASSLFLKMSLAAANSSRICCFWSEVELEKTEEGRGRG
jgi:hypothetical protein